MNKKKVRCRQAARKLPEWAELRMLNTESELNQMRAALQNADRRIVETDRQLRWEVWEMCCEVERRQCKRRQMLCGCIFLLALLGCIGIAGGAEAGTLSVWLPVIPLGIAATTAWIGGWYHMTN